MGPCDGEKGVPFPQRQNEQWPRHPLRCLRGRDLILMASRVTVGVNPYMYLGMHGWLGKPLEVWLGEEGAV